MVDNALNMQAWVDIQILKRVILLLVMMVDLSLFSMARD